MFSISSLTSGPNSSSLIKKGIWHSDAKTAKAINKDLLQGNLVVHKLLYRIYLLEINHK